MRFNKYNLANLLKNELAITIGKTSETKNLSPAIIEKITD